MHVPIIIWRRESEEKLKKQAEDKANEKARQAGELVEAVEEEVADVVDSSLRLDQEEIAALDLDEETAENLGITLAKVAVVSLERIAAFHISGCVCGPATPPDLFFFFLRMCPIMYLPQPKPTPFKRGTRVAPWQSGGIFAAACLTLKHLLVQRNAFFATEKSSSRLRNSTGALILRSVPSLW